MANYTDSATVGALIGVIIGAASRPTTTQMAVFLTLADKKINGEMMNLTGANVSDPSGALSPIAAALCEKMVHNLWAKAEPDDYKPVEVELTAADVRTIHLTGRKWASLSWKMVE